MPKKPSLALVDHIGDRDDSVPTGLGEPGRALWRSVTNEYRIEDSGGRAMLEAACCALDRAADCAIRIAEDGSVIKTKHGPKDHPLLRHELANRSFVVRALARLGLDVEPLRTAPGRPSGGVGISRDRVRK